MSSASATSDWKDLVREKLIHVFGEKDAESLVRVFHYLDEEDKQYTDGDIIPPVWKTLKATLNSDVVFSKYAERLVQDTKRAENDEAFRTKMNQMYQNMMEASENPLEEVDYQGFDLARLTDLNPTRAFGLGGLAHAWNRIPPASQREILALIPKIIDRQLLTVFDDVVSLVDKAGGNVVMVALAALQLSIDVIRSLGRWWRNEITGKRCAKNIIDATCVAGAGVSGGIIGAAMGSVAGPVGTIAGGIIGGVASSYATNIVVDRITQFFFGIPKDEALENAYAYLGVNMTASNNEINAAFRQLCLKHHPDKGGKSEDFIILQMHMGIIKLARGEAL